jgi:hypothetical protein
MRSSAVIDVLLSSGNSAAAPVDGGIKCAGHDVHSVGVSADITVLPVGVPSTNPHGGPQR